MPAHDYRYVIDLFRDDGTPLDQVPVTPDWEPLREWTQFLGVRRGVLPPLMTSAPFQVRPLWQTQDGAPYISGCQIDVTGSNGQTIASQVSTAYFRALAQHAASVLVEKRVLQPGELFRYVVSAFPQPQHTCIPRAEPMTALTVEEVAQPLPLHEMPIAHLAAQAQLYGQSHTEDYPVFIAAQILDDVMALKDQAGAAETGGILIGRLHRDQTLNDIVAEVTAQIPARYTQASEAHLTFTAETWTDVQTALTLRRQDEIMLGWWHTHPVRAWCKCPRERQRHCPLAGEFFSADDGILHRTIFPRAYSLGLVLSDMPSIMTTWTTSWALFGWRHGLIEGRGFSLVGTPRQAATVTTQPPQEGARAHATQTQPVE